MISTEFYEMVMVTLLLFHHMSSFGNSVTVMLTKNHKKQKNRDCHTPIFHCSNER